MPRHNQSLGLVCEVAYCPDGLAAGSGKHVPATHRQPPVARHPVWLSRPSQLGRALFFISVSSEKVDFVSDSRLLPTLSFWQLSVSIDQ
jgi:hypothetical protein